MEIPCPQCGTLNWLQNEKQCHLCQTVLRRCVDCGNFDRSRFYCSVLRGEIPVKDAEHPSLLSTSTNCRKYAFAAFVAPAR